VRVKANGVEVAPNRQPLVRSVNQPQAILAHVDRREAIHVLRHEIEVPRIRPAAEQKGRDVRAGKFGSYGVRDQFVCLAFGRREASHGSCSA